MKKSLFALYKEEREGATVIESDKGFVTAIEFGDYWYIDEIFIKKEFRKSNHATELANKIVRIGRARGYRKLLGSVDINANGAETSKKVLLAYGMTVLLSRETDSLIYFEKNI